MNDYRFAANSKDKGIQKELSLSSDIKTRVALAMNLNLFESVQLRLTKDFPSVRVMLAENLIISKATQEILAKDTEDEVRFALVQNINLCKEAQEILCNDSFFIATKLILNPNIEPHVLLTVVNKLSITNSHYDLLGLKITNNFEKYKEETKLFIVNNMDLFGVAL